MNNKQRKYERRRNARIDKRNKDNELYNDFKTVFSYDHLLSAAKLCKRNVNWKASVQNFCREFHYNVFCIHEDLMSGKFKVKSSYEFDTYERGKKRHIRSVHIRERVVQRCLCDYCLTPIFEKTFIYDNSASIKGKGVHFTLNRLTTHLQRYYRKHGNHGYVLVFDFKDFFGSISHEIIMNMVKERITDERIIEIIQLFVDMYDGDVGLGLGSQISQVFSLVAASPIDHLVKDKFRVKHYIRYMDDGIIIHHDKEFLVGLLEEIRGMAHELGLELNESKTHITKLENGFTFLKKRVSMSESGKITVKISRKSVTRMRRKMKKFRKMLDSGVLDYEAIRIAYDSWRGFAIKYNNYATIMSMDKLFDDLFADAKAAAPDINAYEPDDEAIVLAGELLYEMMDGDIEVSDLLFAA